MGFMDLFKKKAEGPLDKGPDRLTNKTLNNTISERENINPPYYVSELGKARYCLEHQALKDQFFSRPSLIVEALLHRNDTVYGLFCLVRKDFKVDVPYGPNDFYVSSMRENADINVICIECPEPKYCPLCYRIYLFYSDDFSILAYYTIECGTNHNAFICGWDGDKHLNFQEIQRPPVFDKDKGLWMATEHYIMIKLHKERFGLEDKEEQ